MSAPSKVPPPPSFENLTPDAVLAEIQDILNSTSTLHDDLAATFTPATATFHNVVRPIVDDTNRAACRLRILTILLGQLSPDRGLRDAAREAEKRVATAQANVLMRPDIASLVAAIHEHEIQRAALDGTLDGQDQHLLAHIHGEYVRSGAYLRNEEDRQQLRAALEEINHVRCAAQAAFTEEDDGIWFERPDLAGVPENILASMPQEGTRTQVTFRNGHVTAVMRYAVSIETRRRLFVAEQNRLPENVTRLASLVSLRDKVARLLGFEHHAALKIDNKMAPSVPYVEAQLDGLQRKLKPLALAETNNLIRLKERDYGEPVSELYSWERAYYIHRQTQENFSVDQVLLSEYFEANHTLQGMLDVFHDLFWIDFKPIQTSAWHDSVVAYEAWDTPSEGGKFLGHLYVDLFERKGKYHGAHHILIQPGFIEANGEKHYPASAFVCSFPEPSLSRPSLLQHSEVKTMFHELGHSIHNIAARTKCSIPHSRDFIEIPSIILENWIWLPDVLIRLGRHYTRDHDGQGALPRELAESIARTRNVNRANNILAQVQPALFDLAIHSPSSHKAALDMDTTEIWNRTKRNVLTHSFGPNPQNWGAGQARFAHMFRKNDGSYFAYPLSMVFAVDIFMSAFAQDPMSPETGRRYRYQVLEPGSSLPEIEILKDFLGREPSSETIINELYQYHQS
ncbi:metallo ase [Fusarium beomiforme]|uniref:Metallo ase n=1 Tax=Fusarium beomiforme TaxID=44412 RepID=A0A9P5DT17_9HYPO|nr:metallo ase [Fusarium beomiforme]